MKRIEKNREWQEEFRRVYRERHQAGEIDFLLQATMGAGKTYASLNVADDLLREGSITRVVVVTRSIGLRDQWVAEASQRGISLEGDWHPFDKPLTPTFIGLVITYQKLANPMIADFFERFCADYPTLVIMDEPHHMSEDDDTSWGVEAARGFAGAFRRLLLTATPWRTDGSQIPFVEYDASGVVKAHFPYSYARAIIDNVCRMVFFPTLNGTAEYAINENIIEHKTLVGVTKAQLGKVCTTLFKPGAGWIMTTLDCAHADLLEKRRNGHPDAGGLVVVNRCEDAKDLARTLRDRWDVEVIVATSDVKDEGSRQIDRFKKGKMPWLVAVGMVSEGVDIPRLRVGVYATNVRTLLMFRQFVGRFLRMIGDLDDVNECATVYIALLQPWVKYAEDMEEEVEQALREEGAQSGKTPGESPTDAPVFTVLGSTGVESDVIGSGDFISQEEITKAQNVAQRMGLRVEGPQLALFIRRYGVPQGPANGDQRTEGKPPVNESRERKELTKRCTVIGRHYVKKMLGDAATQNDFQRFFGETIPQRWGCILTRASNERLYEIRDWLLALVAGRAQ